jgi:valine--pyruvate aminotransferase
MADKKTRFYKRYAGHSGIGELMEDLGKAMASGDMLMLGGGNPASIPEVNQLWNDRLAEMVKEGDELARALGNYDTPQGHHLFMSELSDFLNRHFDFNITEKNIAVTNGSQTAMFNLMNLLGGTGEDGIMRKILFPLVPEYIGYADQHLEQDAFLALRPEMEFRGEHRFKYHIDFKALEQVNVPLGALCVSRPTNPTGNVLSDDEVNHLQDFCK